MKAIDLTGKRFGRLVVERRDGSSKKRTAMWLCKCDCGNSKRISGYNLRRGTTQSCGCLQREICKYSAITHGMKGTSIYRIWSNMRNRCNNPKYKDYKRYGGRGIMVCKRWNKFENFYKDMGERPKGMTLDREDNSKGYYKSNCRWASFRTQCNNRRNNHRLVFKGRTQTIAGWSREVGISQSTLWARLDSKWSVERTLTKAVNKQAN